MDKQLIMRYTWVMKNGYVYILSNQTNSVLYVGVTSDLLRRLYEHRNHLVEGFTDKYNVTKLLYYEGFALVEDAIQREKQLKGWRRNKKFDLIKTLNPELVDLYDSLMKE